MHRMGRSPAIIGMHAENGGKWLHRSKHGMKRLAGVGEMAEIRLPDDGLEQTVADRNRFEDVDLIVDELKRHGLDL